MHCVNSQISNSTPPSSAHPPKGDETNHELQVQVISNYTTCMGVKEKVPFIHAMSSLMEESM